MNLPILPLPVVESARTLAQHCLAVGALGVLLGPNGTGKTEALKALLKLPRLLPEALTGYYYQAAQANGPSRAVRDLLVDLEVRQAIHQRGTSLPIAIRLAYRELQERKIGLLLIDEADLLAVDSLQGIISLYDHCRNKGNPIALIFSGVQPIERWIGALPAAWSRTLKVAHVEPLTIELTCALFAAGSGPIVDLAQRVKDNQREALKALALIHQTSGGNLRRLTYFAKIAVLYPDPIDTAQVRVLLEHITRG